MNCLRISQLYGAVLSVKISFTNLLEIIENNSIYVRCILAKNLFGICLLCLLSPKLLIAKSWTDLRNSGWEAKPLKTICENGVIHF